MTNNNIYLNWTPYVANKWKKSTLSTLARRAYEICLTNEHLQNELSHIKKSFHEENQSHFGKLTESCEIKRIINQQLQKQHHQQSPTNSSHEEEPNSKEHLLLLHTKENGLII